MKSVRFCLLAAGALILPGAVAWASGEREHLPGTWLNWLSSVQVAGRPLISSPAWLAFWWALVVAVLLAAFSAITTRRLKVYARPGQLTLETLVSGIRNLLETVMGPRAAEFLPFIGSLFIYITSMNLLGLVPGMMAPTSNLNITASLAVISFVAIHYTGFRESKLSYLKHFVEGVPLKFSLKVTAMLTLLAMVPIAVLVLVSHLVASVFLPVTLAMRLYGNVMGEEKVVESLIGVVAHGAGRWIPVQLPNMMLGVVTSLVQAVIFSMLTTVNLSLVLHEKHDTEALEAT